MQWVIWLDSHTGVATALPTILLAIITAWLGVMTWLNARRTKDLAQQSKDTFVLQFLAFYLEQMGSGISSDPSSPLAIMLEGIRRRKVRDLLTHAFPNEMELVRAILDEAHEPEKK